MPPHSLAEPELREPASAGAARPRVVYVMGAGRSGSTVLGVVLGNCDGVFYAGELDAWLRKEGRCNFGGDAREEFWGDVAAEVGEGPSLFGERARRYVEHSTAIFRPRPGRRALRRRYRRIAASLYGAIAARSDCGTIVDTSHYPLRARQLQQLEGVDLYLLYLVRDPESVVASFSKRDVDQPAQSPLRANVYLHLTNLLSTLVYLRQPRQRRLLVGYEDFVARPEENVARILGWLGLDADVPDLGALDTGLPFQGNRLLRSSSIALQRGGPKRKRRRRLTALAQAPWRPVQRLLDSLSARPPRS
jgi:Sulfotransferase family